MKEKKVINGQPYFSDPNVLEDFEKDNKLFCSMLSGLLFGIFGVFAVYVIPNRRTPSNLLFEPGISVEYGKALDYIYQERLQKMRREYAWMGFMIGTVIYMALVILFLQNQQDSLL